MERYCPSQGLNQHSTVLKSCMLPIEPHRLATKVMEGRRYMSDGVWHFRRAKYQKSNRYPMLWVLIRILMRTHNIGFGRELVDLECHHSLLSGALERYSNSSVKTVMTLTSIFSNFSCTSMSDI